MPPGIENMSKDPSIQLHLRAALLAWVASTVLGSYLAAWAVYPGVDLAGLASERADFVARAEMRWRLGWGMLLLRPLAEVHLALALLRHLRRLPFQPGLGWAVLATVAATAAAIADFSGVYLLIQTLPQAASGIAAAPTELDLPDPGGLLGSLAELVEQLAGLGRRAAYREFVRIEAWGLRRVGAYGAGLHGLSLIALYAVGLAQRDREGVAPSLTVSAWVAVVLHILVAGATYMAVELAGYGYPRIAIAFVSALLAPIALALFAGSFASALRLADDRA